MNKIALTGLTLAFIFAFVCAGCGGSGSSDADLNNDGGDGSGGTVDGGDAGGDAGGPVLAHIGESCVSVCGGRCAGVYLNAGGVPYLITAEGNTCDVTCISSTSRGGYCSGSCSSDADCGNATTPMRCIDSCGGQPDVVGRCWSETDYTQVVQALCP